MWSNLAKERGWRFVICPWCSRLMGIGVRFIFPFIVHWSLPQQLMGGGGREVDDYLTIINSCSLLFWLLPCFCPNDVNWKHHACVYNNNNNEVFISNFWNSFFIHGHFLGQIRNYHIVLIASIHGLLSVHLVITPLTMILSLLTAWLASIYIPNYVIWISLILLSMGDSFCFLLMHLSRLFS